MKISHLIFLILFAACSTTKQVHHEQKARKVSRLAAEYGKARKFKVGEIVNYPDISLKLFYDRSIALERNRFHSEIVKKYIITCPRESRSIEFRRIDLDQSKKLEFMCGKCNFVFDGSILNLKSCD